eukprot:CAMPEP_0167740296 /NCGR_PEP_ID=MMETSP0110_2-20121227/196_1 /TAXON_ID=629695 /ORGANISM="Gymnochlora sp., Strain CCMP2014" /LENGTH=590 /DNA_ID=CAMNT_0007624169 /DNA_START=253 /DNA_END=2021 /DNA_ORIENTATION=+
MRISDMRVHMLALLRIVVDIFHLNVEYAMGVTDIDDKIIARARETNENPLHLARRFENRFFEDLSRLNVRFPMVRLRVTEHIPEIINFIQKIIDNGYAYDAGDGNIYFDVKAYESGSLGFSYSKFRVLKDAGSWGGEVSDENVSGKRSPADFALWKGFKSGIDLDEYSWEAPWGKGRPGWHIECSAMATNLFGEELSVHTGGIDLQFPHHNNEIAQCCAHHSTVSWGHTWMHTGHLNIEGLKMSKSLKNFVTIREFLENTASPDDLRMFCLLHHYSAPVDFTERGIMDARSILNKFEALQSRINYLRKTSASEEETHGIMRSRAIPSLEIHRSITKAKHSVLDALSNDFDTPLAVRKLLNLSTDTQRFLDEASSVSRQKSGEKFARIDLHSAEDAWNVIANYMSLFGIRRFNNVQEIDAEPEEKNEGKVSILDIADAIAACRMGVRNAVKSSGETLSASQSTPILKWTDAARDSLLPILGKKLNDLPDGTYRITEWSERQQKLEKKRRKEDDLNRVEREKAANENAEMIRNTPAEEMYLKDTDKYLKFDETGIPTHDVENNPLSKNLKKKLMKAQRRHADRRAKLLEVSP